MELKKTKKYFFKNAEFDDEKGTLKAVFATMNVIDDDDDFTLPGAFGEQKVIISSYGHGSWRGTLPVGKGKIYESGIEAIIEGKFFLDTEGGRETYKTVKNIDELQEWSYALPEIDYEMKEMEGRQIRVLKRIVVPEVSPVLMGSGVNTRLLDIKQLKNAINSHTTLTSDESWSASKNVARLKKDETGKYYRKMFAWVDPDGDPDIKSSYKFPNHFVSEGGIIESASIKACQNGIAVLNGARGGADIPSADRQGVWRHLAKHLKDADIEPAELKSFDSNQDSMKILDHIEYVYSEIKNVLDRLLKINDIRSEKGKTISGETLKRIDILVDGICEMENELKRIRYSYQDVCLSELLNFHKIINDRRFICQS